MKKKLFFLTFSFWLFSLIFNFFTPSIAQAIQLADVGNPGRDASDLVQMESVSIPLSNKLILKDGTPVKNVFDSTDDMLNLLVKVLFVGAGLVLFLMIISAGFAMIAGDSKDKDKAKSTMTTAAIGFIVMFAAYWIMQIIEILIGTNLNF